MPFTLRSPAFNDGRPIPPKYTRDGDNRSPPLEWKDAPAGTRSFALIMDDPDAPNGLFKHWALYDIDATRRALPEGMASAGRQACNDFGHAHYDGPDPPAGHGMHHYHFHLMALDIDALSLPHQASVEDVRSAARRHLLAESELIGTYSH